MIDNGGTPTPIIFPDWLNHKDVAQRLGRYGPVTSAGFVAVGRDERGLGKATAYGRSESLNLPSNPEVDSKALSNVIFR